MIGFAQATGSPYYKAMLDKAHMKKLGRVCRKHEISFAYLFGSRAYGRVNKESDFDFAAYTHESSKEKRFQLRLKLIEELSEIFYPTHVDVVMLNDTHSSMLRYEIITNGELVYQRDTETHATYALHAMKEYEAFAPFLEAYNREYLKTAV